MVPTGQDARHRIYMRPAADGVAIGWRIGVSGTERAGREHEVLGQALRAVDHQPCVIFWEGKHDHD